MKALVAYYYDLKLHQIDMKIILLNDNLDKEIYMKQLIGSYKR